LYENSTRTDPNSVHVINLNTNTDVELQLINQLETEVGVVELFCPSLTDEVSSHVSTLRQVA
jgi:hypothetical protein